MHLAAAASMCATQISNQNQEYFNVMWRNITLVQTSEVTEKCYSQALGLPLHRADTKFWALLLSAAPDVPVQHSQVFLHVTVTVLHHR